MGCLLTFNYRGTFSPHEPFLFESDEEMLMDKGVTIEDGMVVPDEKGRCRVLVANGSTSEVTLQAGVYVGAVS